MTTPTPDGSVALDLSREERWVAHHATLDRIEEEVEEGRDAEAERTLLSKLESGDADYGPAELRLLRLAVDAYIDGAADRDVVSGRAVLASIDGALA